MKGAVREFFLKFVIHSYYIKPKIMFWVYSIRNFSDRTRAYEFKLEELEFSLDMGKKLFSVRMLVL